VRPRSTRRGPGCPKNGSPGLTEHGIERAGDAVVAVAGGVLDEEGGGGEEWPSRHISSLVVAPVAAAKVAPVWRNSCGRTAGSPRASAGRRKVEFQLLRAR
jgi:hypothetical protein